MTWGTPGGELTSKTNWESGKPFFAPHYSSMGLKLGQGLLLSKIFSITITSKSLLPLHLSFKLNLPPSMSNYGFHEMQNLAVSGGSGGGSDEYLEFVPGGNLTLFSLIGLTIGAVGLKFV